MEIVSLIKIGKGINMINLICINKTQGHTCKHNETIIYDKITDRIIAVVQGKPIVDARTGGLLEIPFEVPSPLPVQIIDSLTNKDTKNAGMIHICDGVHCEYHGEYYVKNGQLRKRYLIQLSCDATDHDNDGLPDIEGDGISICNLTASVIDPDTNMIATDMNGKFEIQLSRGKIMTGLNSIINYIDGIANFAVRSVPETVKKVSIRMKPVLDNGITKDVRFVTSDYFYINYR
jgi:hypothetical protein